MAVSTSLALALPTAMGRFQPRSVLGQGGQGIVYLAYDPQLDREVALKTLTVRARDPQKLLNEARNVARLEHPNIVGLFEIELKHEPPYLVYQYAPGRPLTAVCNGQEILPIKRAVTVMIAVLDAIYYAHQRQILHRDLTPANILLDNADHPRILDFGISIVLNDETGAHAIAGTPNYLAPEVLANQPPGPQADLYSLSVVLHEMLCGRRLFQAENPMAVIYKVINERVLPPSMSRDGIDTALDKIVMRGLEKDPQRRFQSAAAMRDALQEYLQPHTEVVVAGSSENDVTGTISFLQRRMSRKPDFPAVSRHIAELNQKTDAAAQSHVNDLAAVILKDFALTTKLLKMVNSAVHGQYGGSISTVSRAVVILGLEQVRALALGIIIFEHLKSGDQANLLKDAACSSFLSAMLARSICATEQPQINAEEAFVGAMFHRLGRHLAIYYFPNEYGEVLAVIASKGVDEDVAAREIFGADFAEFGVAIGREWRLPERLIQAMRPQRQPQIKAGKTPEQLVAQLSAFSNEIAEIAAGDARDMEQRLSAVLERYRECVTSDIKTLKAAVLEAVNATREFAGLIGVNLDSSPVLGKVKRAMAAVAASGGAGFDSAPPTDEGNNGAAETQEQRGSRRHLFLTNAISELTTAIIERASLNDLFAMVLEALYRSMDFTHVLFLLRDPARKTYATRFGFGADVEELKSRFEYRPEDREDIFQQAVQKGRNAVIIDTDDERYSLSIPDWCREMTRPRSILVFAVIVNKVCVGVIYADTCTEQLCVNAQELQLLNTLVKQLTLGVHQR